MPLQFEPGEEAQVDWHEGHIIDNGVERKVQFFVMKLCFSKAPMSSVKHKFLPTTAISSLLS
jgi:hypothetical protein